MAKKLKRSNYVKAADVLQKVLGVDPAEFEQDDLETLKVQMVEAAGLLNMTDVPHIDKATWAVLDDLGFSKDVVEKIPVPEENEDKEGGEAEAEAEEPEENNEPEEAKTQLTADEILAMGKKELKIVIKKDELDIDAKEYKKVEDLQLAVLDVLGIDVPEPKEATKPKLKVAEKKEAPKVEKKKKVIEKKKGIKKDYSKTHFGCAGDVIKQNKEKKIKIDILIEKVNTLHKNRSGRKTTLDSTSRMIKALIHFCVQYGIATTDDISLTILKN